MSEQGTRVLIVEDSRTDSTLLTRMLSGTGRHQYHVVHATTLGEAEEAAKAGPVDVIICDLSLPDSSGLATFSRLRACAPDSAVLVISGTDDETLAVRSVREGAQDY